MNIIEPTTMLRRLYLFRDFVGREKKLKLVNLVENKFSCILYLSKEIRVTRKHTQSIKNQTIKKKENLH